MIGTYIFCVLSLAGAIYLCWCFVELQRASKRRQSMYAARVHQHAPSVVVGHHCVVSIREGKRAPATPVLTAGRREATDLAVIANRAVKQHIR